MRRIKHFLGLLLIGICLVSILSACGEAAKKRAEPMEESKIAALREEYRYLDEEPLGNRIEAPELKEDLMIFGKDLVGFFVIEIADGENEEHDNYLDPTGGEKPELTNNYPFICIPAKIQEVVVTRENREIDGEDMWLLYGKNFSDEDVFIPARRFLHIAIINDATENAEIITGCDPVYCGDRLMSFYITEDDHILSLNADPEADFYSGWTLEAFEEELRSTFRELGW